MSSHVLRFPNRPTADELVRRIRELAADSDNIDFAQPHFKEQLEKRDLSMTQVLDVIRNGEPLKGPRRDDYGDWRIKLAKVSAGRRVQVVVAVKDDLVTTVTVI